MSLKLLPSSFRISLVPFRTFRGPLFPKPVTGKELFLAVSYSKPALELYFNFREKYADIPAKTNLSQNKDRLTMLQVILKVAICVKCDFIRCIFINVGNF